MGKRNTQHEVEEILSGLGRPERMAALAERRASRPDQIDDSSLYAGSPMHFYCVSCGHLSDVLPESYTTRPARLCPECDALKGKGWLDQ